MSYYQISYGTFGFYTKVLNSTASIIYEEDHATVVGTNYSFSVDTWIFGSTVAQFGIALNNAKCQLQTPRLAFVVQWSPDGITWTQLYDFSSANDIDYGPKPRDVQITKFSGGRAARLTFNIDVQVKECYGNTCGVLSRPSEILAYTRSFTHSVDVDGYTRRTVSGKLVLTSIAVLNGVTPDAYRYFVCPDMPAQFQRDSENFVTSVDGRTMTYSVTDIEYNNTLPQPVTSGDASWSVSTTDYGSLLTYTLTGEFSAPKTVPKSTLLTLLANLISAKFPLAQVATNGVIFESRELTERDFYKKNTLAFTVRAKASGGVTSTPGTFSFSAGLNTIGNQPPSPDSTGTAYLVNPYGGPAGGPNSNCIAAPLQLFDACDNPGDGGWSPGDGIPAAPNDPTGTPGDNNPSTGDNSQSPGSQDDTGSTADQLRSPWSRYTERMRWQVTNFIATMPTKDPSADPVMFQTAAPICTFYQIGEAQRMVNQMTDAPQAPAPHYDSDQAVMLDSWVEPEVGQTIGEGPYTLFTARWYYKMRLVANINTEIDDEAKYPNDPRVTAQPPAFDFPDGLVVDPG